MRGESDGLASRWWTFVGERFPPAAHLLMTAAFLAGNAAAAVVLLDVTLQPRRLMLTAGVVLLAFFRLRVFDEIKDRRTDRSIHPDRPLARGLLTVEEARRGTIAVAGVELVLAAAAGPAAAVAWGVMTIFSLLMYREFFVGGWLRPRMELYAVSHTLVAAWLGLFVAAALSDHAPWRVPGLWLFAVANWVVFNVFEFARKTYAVDEERDGVDSYSRRLGAAGASFLSLGMAVAAAGTAFLALGIGASLTWAHWALLGLGLLILAAAVTYACRPRRAAARLFRAAMQAFIVGFYPLLALAVFLEASR